MDLKEELIKFLNSIADNVGGTINEYHWREASALIDALKDPKPLLIYKVSETRITQLEIGLFTHETNFGYFANQEAARLEMNKQSDIIISEGLFRVSKKNSNKDMVVLESKNINDSHLVMKKITVHNIEIK